MNMEQPQGTKPPDDHQLLAAGSSPARHSNAQSFKSSFRRRQLGSSADVSQPEMAMQLSAVRLGGTTSLCHAIPRPPDTPRIRDVPRLRHDAKISGAATVPALSEASPSISGRFAFASWTPKVNGGSLRLGTRSLPLPPLQSLDDISPAASTASSSGEELSSNSSGSRGGRGVGNRARRPICEASAQEGVNTGCSATVSKHFSTDDGNTDTWHCRIKHRAEHKDYGDDSNTIDSSNKETSPTDSRKMGCDGSQHSSSTRESVSSELKADDTETNRQVSSSDFTVKPDCLENNASSSCAVESNAGSCKVLGLSVCGDDGVVDTYQALAAELFICSSNSLLPDKLGDDAALNAEAMTKSNGSNTSGMGDTQPLAKMVTAAETPGITAVEAELQEILAERIAGSSVASTHEILAEEIRSSLSRSTHRGQQSATANAAAVKIQAAVRGCQKRAAAVRSAAEEAQGLRELVDQYERCLLPSLVTSGTLCKAALRSELSSARKAVDIAVNRAALAEAESASLRAELATHVMSGRRGRGGG